MLQSEFEQRVKMQISCKEYQSINESAMKSITKALEDKGLSAKYICYGYKSATVILALNCAERKEIEVSYKQKGDSLTTNVAAMGSFEMDMNETAIYYIAVGSLLSDQKAISSIKEELKNFITKIVEFEKEVKG